MNSISTLQQPAPPQPLLQGSRTALEYMLADADVHMDGKRPWDIVIHDSRMPLRILRHGSLGAGESYMEGWWDCGQLDEMFARIFGAQVDSKLGKLHEKLADILARIRNAQSRRRASAAAACRSIFN